MGKKYGLLKLGRVINIRPNEKGQNCMSILSKLIGRKIRLEEINTFIESDDFNREFFDINGNITDETLSVGFRFKLPWQDIQGNDIYGRFSKSGTIFIGVLWDNKPRIQKYGNITPTCWEKIQSICGIGVTESNIEDYITSNIEYYNGAGYTKFPDGTAVTAETGKFIKFHTSIRSSGEMLVGWFTKDIRSGRFEGISWGTEADFKSAQDLREQFYVGRMVFDSIEECNIFLDELKKKIIPEPWEYKHKKDNRFNHPILKSYLQFEVDRLFYEQDILQFPDKVIFNKDRSKVWLNTNLINKYGRDLFIVGTLFEISNKPYIGELQIAPSLKDLKEWGFDSSKPPIPPMFFQDINEIVFHCDWEIDRSMDRYEHIIEDRIERFPEKYRDLTSDDLGLRLDNAINLAKNIAQRNYKFIVPMYYPTKNRIQLLMPIYLESSYSSRPDFALVITPDANEKMYSLETILGLDEVYQDARLVAKPEESWLNPDIIE